MKIRYFAIIAISILVSSCMSDKEFTKMAERGAREGNPPQIGNRARNSWVETGDAFGILR